MDNPWVDRILRGLLSLAFVGAGASKLVDPAAAADANGFGYSGTFMLIIGVCEIAGAIGLWLPKFTALAAAGLLAIMFGAVASHLINDPLGNALPAAIIVLLLCAVLYLHRDELPGAGVGGA